MKKSLHYIAAAIVLALFAITSNVQALQPSKKYREELLAQIYDTKLDMEKRIGALQVLYNESKYRDHEYRVCIWDPIGRHGPIFSAAKDRELEIESWGIKLDMIPFTHESVLVEELKSGVCDVALMSGLRARLFNRYTGTLDAIGGLFNWDQVKLVHRLMAHPQSAPKMQNGDYMIMGIAPGGAAHVFVNDKNINTLEKAAGKRVAVLDYDPTQAKMIAGIGATPVATDLANAPNKFNNGNVDVLAAPLIAYGVMELYKGMEPNGGIIDLPLAYISMQLVGRADMIPVEAAQLCREAFFNEFETIKSILRTEAEKIPRKWFVPIPEEDRIRYDKKMQEARLQLVEDEYYDPSMLSTLRKVRCNSDPKRPECINPVE